MPLAFTWICVFDWRLRIGCVAMALSTRMSGVRRVCSGTEPQIWAHIQAARGLEFCVLGIVVHLRLGLFANTNACICDSDAVSGIDKDAFMLFALDLIGSGSHK